MMNPESFNDQELAYLLESETTSLAEDQRDEERRRVVGTRLREAIDKLEIATVVGDNPAHYQQDFNDLLDILHEACPTDEREADPLLFDRNIRLMAMNIWDSEYDVLTGFSQAIEAQLFPDTPDVDLSAIKKQFMAKLIAYENNTEQWLELADYVLEGDALDTEQPADMELLLKEIEDAANRDATPEAQLYDQIASLLGVADLDEDSLSADERARADILIFASRDITEAACVLAGSEAQPDRHEWIHGLFRRYNIVDQEQIKKIFTLTDAFVAAE